MWWLQTGLSVLVRFWGCGFADLQRWLEVRGERGWLRKCDGCRGCSFAHAAVLDHPPLSRPTFLLALLSIPIFLKTKPNPDAANCAKASLDIWVSLLCCTYIKVLAQVANESALILFIFSHPAFRTLESGFLDVKR